jgi:protein STE50
MDSLHCFPSDHYRLISAAEHNLTGDVLCIMGPEDLKELGIATVGQRLAILKAIYLMKVAHDIHIEPDHYIPPC